MGIEALTQVISSPSAPAESSVDWPQVEEKIGTPLPDDYKEFIQKYGTGVIDSFFWIFNPVSKNKNLNLIERIKISENELNTLRAQLPDRFTYAPYPNAGGLMPAGTTDNGDMIYWKTGKQPNQWSIVIGSTRDGEFEEFETGFTDFLVSLISRRFSSRILPSTFPSVNAKFDPLNPS
jgi:hypothetical protein